MQKKQQKNKKIKKKNKIKLQKIGTHQNLFHVVHKHWCYKGLHDIICVCEMNTLPLYCGINRCIFLFILFYFGFIARKIKKIAQYIVGAVSKSPCFYYHPHNILCFTFDFLYAGGKKSADNTPIFDFLHTIIGYER